MGSRSKYVSVIWQFIQVAYDFSKHVVPYTCYCLLAGKLSTTKHALSKQLDYGTRVRLAAKRCFHPANRNKLHCPKKHATL